jgi:hypothetical protein
MSTPSEIAGTILAQIKASVCQSILWSWGMKELVAIPNGLRFKVNGFLHNGYVEIVINKGTDLYEVSLLKRNGTVVKKLEGIYCDELGHLIDSVVETADASSPEYKAQVKNSLYKF